MANNEYVNKIVYDNNTLIDLTEDTVTAATLMSGVTAHDRSGAPITGTGSYVESVNGQSGVVTLTIPPTMTILSYGHSTWADFLAAYNSNTIVYCRASSNANPGTGTQGRMAFMAYLSLNSSGVPTSVEFQYYRSVSSHSASQQGDQVFIYQLTNSNGGTWSVTVREAMSKIAAGTNMSSSYSNGTLTLNNSYTLPTASTSTLGGVKVDGSTITISNGVISSSGGSSGPLIINISDGESGRTMDKTASQIMQALVTNGAICRQYEEEPGSYSSDFHQIIDNWGEYHEGDNDDYGFWVNNWGLFSTNSADGYPICTS